MNVELEITEPPSGPVQIEINKRYGNSASLGEITRWEDHNRPATAVRAFAKGGMACRVDYGKQGSSERRALHVYSSADDTNSFMLQASTGEEIISDNVEILKTIHDAGNRLQGGRIHSERFEHRRRFISVVHLPSVTLGRFQNRFL